MPRGQKSEEDHSAFLNQQGSIHDSGPRIFLRLKSLPEVERSECEFLSFLLFFSLSLTPSRTNTLPSSPEHPLVTSLAHPTNPLCLITECNLMTNSNYALMLPFMGFSIQTLSFFMPPLIQTTLGIIKKSKWGQLKEQFGERSNSYKILNAAERHRLTSFHTVPEIISHESFDHPSGK